jgi:monoamine oxidase
VVGAGLAGLTAAYHLKKRGWDVDVYEARDKAGGRVRTHRFKEAPGLTCELGAEWIGADHREMRRMCSKFGLRLQGHRFSFSFWEGAKPSKYFRPGDWSYSRRSKEAFQKFKRQFERYSEPDCRHLDQFDWWTKLKQLGFSYKDLTKRDWVDSTDCGESIRLASAYIAASEYTGHYKTNHMDFRIRGGNDRLVGALVDRIGKESVHESSPVRAIHQDAGSVKVYVSGRKTPERADFCICTVPAHLLKQITWSPALPPEQCEAAEQLQYSRIMKTAILYERRFWPNKIKKGGFSFFTNRVSDFCFDATYRQRGRQGILCSYATGEKADDLAAEPKKEIVGDWISKDVASVVAPGQYWRTVANPIKIKRRAWQEEKWVHGAYAFYRPGQWFTIRPLLLRPHGRVHFAGEHLADEQGFMEGAVRSGKAVADSL